MTDEYKFKDGEMAWSPFSGWGKVEINFADKRTYRVKHGPYHATYTNDGRRLVTDKHPTLLTVEQAAKLGYFPPKKKRKVEVKVWANVYPMDDYYAFHNSKEKADEEAGLRRIACVEMTGVYEIEE
jgi:hypothetical protein